MTSPSDREVFLNEVREAIWADLHRQADGPMRLSVDREISQIDGYVDVGDLAEAAVDAMARRLGPEF
ncbi:hypothetical protein [Mycobacterium sp. DL99]|uniref:hypothetical protein n=1 Tax=Mycobacterium sp. DL99 TaxID=2528957 RepID=UPI0010800493|nr:hypothetical protein [Mycobacterium sp. DL99]